MKRFERIYLDYAASTPVDPRVFRAMLPYFSAKFGNPGSLHSFGQDAIAAVDVSRETIAKAIGTDFRNIIFTASATEANNLVLRGAVRGAMSYELGDMKSFLPPTSYLLPRIIISAIEHESVLETARELEKEGIDVVYLPVGRDGIVDLKKLKESLTDETVLVSIMYANNEVGTIQPIAEIAEIIQAFRDSKFQTPHSKQIPITKLPNYQITQLPNYPLFHSDCSQAFQFLDCNVESLGVDFMTLSAHKIYGPKGAGCLYMSESVRSAKRKAQSDGRYAISDSRFAALIAGGGQEFGFRSGTENVPAIVGFAKAVEMIPFQCSQEHWNEIIAGLRDDLWRGIKKIYPKAELNGAMSYELEAKNSYLLPPTSYLPNFLNIYFPGHDAQDLLTRFDLAGLAVSSGSACRSRAMESSYVIEAMGYPKARAKSSIRVSLGRPTTKQEIKRALKIIRDVLR